MLKLHSDRNLFPWYIVIVLSRVFSFIKQKKGVDNVMTVDL